MLNRNIISDSSPLDHDLLELSSGLMKTSTFRFRDCCRTTVPFEQPSSLSHTHTQYKFIHHLDTQIAKIMYKGQTYQVSAGYEGQMLASSWVGVLEE